MPRKSFHEDLIDNYTGILSKTNAREHYYSYCKYFEDKQKEFGLSPSNLLYTHTSLKPSVENNFIELDQIYNTELDALCVKVFQIFPHSELILNDVTPLLQALFYRRMTKILDHHLNSKKALAPIGKTTLMHDSLCMWKLINGIPLERLV